MSALVEVHGATVSHDGRRVLDHVDVTIGPREIVTLIGPNGAGKSTLVKVVLGLARLDAGHIHRKADLKIGYQPQRFAVDRALPLSVDRLLTLTQRHPRARLEQALAEVGVAHLIDASVHTLSGGELQRVTLARAMLRAPDLLVLDEPTQNVDMAGSVDIYKIIAALPEKLGCSVLVVSHDLNVVMAATDRVYCLNGHICCSGRPEDISRHPEYLRLLGSGAANTLAVYPHTHDHTHGPDGAIHHGHSHG